MPAMAQLYFRTAILFLIAGICIGIYMSMSGNHAVVGAHAHINLLGWVTSALFGVYLALNPAKATGLLPRLQYIIYVLGVVVMGGSLYLMLCRRPALCRHHLHAGPQIAGHSALADVSAPLPPRRAWPARSPCW